jgi:dTMP kinase
MTTQGKFVVIDGTEGCGKSMQTRLLAEFLQKQGYNVLTTREPGASESQLCAKIRQIILSATDEIFNPMAELFLFSADRAQHCYSVITPALEAGQVVICDRFFASTYAYQVFETGICSREDYEQIQHFATGGLKPDLYIYIDLDPIIGITRNKQMHKDDRFEQKELEYHHRVRQGFLDFFSHYQGDRLIIPGENSIEDITEKIIVAVNHYL